VIDHRGKVLEVDIESGGTSHDGWLKVMLEVRMEAKTSGLRVKGEKMSFELGERLEGAFKNEWFLRYTEKQRAICAPQQKSIYP